MRRRTSVMWSFAGMAAIAAASGAAMADGTSTRVTILPSNGAISSPWHKPPRLPAIQPLSPSAILDAKRQVLEAHKKPRTAATSSTNPLLTVGVGALKASSGALRAETWLESPLVVTGDVVAFNAQGGSIDLFYYGLTPGNLYLLDCGMTEVTSAQVSIGNIGGGDSPTTVTADPSGHIIVGFAAPFDQVGVWLYNIALVGGYANWAWSSCALHAVN